MDQFFQREGSGLTQFAVNLSAFDACSGNHPSVESKLMIPTIGTVLISGGAHRLFRTPAKFAHTEHKGLIQKSTLIQNRSC